MFKSTERVMTDQKKEERKRAAVKSDAPQSFVSNDEAKDTPKRMTVSPPDGGWGWIIVIGCLVAHFLLNGLARSYGIIYVVLQDRFTSSSAVTAWIGALYNAIRLGAGTISALLVNRFEFRPVVMTGGLLMCAGFVASAFSQKIFFLFVTYSGLIGFGAALVFAPGYIIIRQYFDKKLGKAMGFATVGCGLGGLCLPWCVKILYDVYAFPGAMIVLGGIMLNCCVTGALYRSLESSRNTARNQVNPIESEVWKDTSDKSKNKNASLDSAKYETRISEVKQESTVNIEPVMIDNEQSITTKTKGKNSALLRNRTFVIYTFTSMCLTITQQTFNIFVVALAKEKGLDDNWAILLTTVCGLADMIGPFLSGFCFDATLIRPYRRHFLCVFLLAGGICVALIPFTVEFYGLASFSFFIGFFLGSGHAQRVTVLTDFVEISHMPSATGFLISFQGLGQIFGPAFSGFLKEYFGVYSATFYFGGSCLILTTILFIIESSIQSCRAK